MAKDNSLLIIGGIAVIIIIMLYGYQLGTFSIIPSGAIVEEQDWQGQKVDVFYSSSGVGSVSKNMPSLSASASRGRNAEQRVGSQSTGVVFKDLDVKKFDSVKFLVQMTIEGTVSSNQNYGQSSVSASLSDGTRSLPLFGKSRQRSPSEPSSHTEANLVIEKQTETVYLITTSQTSKLLDVSSLDQTATWVVSFNSNANTNQDAASSSASASLSFVAVQTEGGKPPVVIPPPVIGSAKDISLF